MDWPHGTDQFDPKFGAICDYPGLGEAVAEVDYPPVVAAKKRFGQFGVLLSDPRHWQSNSVHYSNEI